MRKLYKSCISVRAVDGEHLRGVSAEDAREFVLNGLADEIDEGKAFIGKIRLRIPLESLRERLHPPKRRPRPPQRMPASSTGDAGRGNTLIHRFRTVRLERQSALV